MVIRRKKDLGMLLEKIPSFPHPEEALEQYETPSEVAAEMLWLAYMRGDIKGKTVVDLGCGTGRLAVGAALLGARFVLCVDVDEYSLKIARNMLKTVREVPYEVLETDIRRASFARRLGNCTVVMNPPYGVKSKGSDIEFLQKAMEICDTIYSFHKISKGLKNVIDKVARENLYEYESIAIRDFFLKPTMKKHRKRTYYLNVALIIFKKNNIPYRG